MASDDSKPSPLLGSAFGAVRKRYRVFIAAAALIGFGVLGAQAWRHAQTGMRDDPRYRVTADSIDATPPPAWIRTDIRAEALRDAGLHGGLSILDPPEKLEKRITDAFAFHPWVERVDRVAKRPPNRVVVELSYRRPLAAIELPGPGGELAPVDARRVRLPSGGLTDAELRYLPRVRGVTSTTLAGEVWGDARVAGAVSLIASLGEKWRGLELVDVIPSRQTEVRGEMRFYVYDLVTSGQTRIVWGAAPNASPPDEAPFKTKLARLEAYVAQNGPLNSTVGTPAVVKVREQLAIEQRTVKRTEADADEEPLVK